MKKRHILSQGGGGCHKLRHMTEQHIVLSPCMSPHIFNLSYIASKVNNHIFLIYYKHKLQVGEDRMLILSYEMNS